MTSYYFILTRFVLPMLSLLRADCTMCHLEKAVEKAVSEIKDYAQEREQILQQIPQSQRDNGSRELNEVFVQRVKEAGFSTALARKALKEVEPSNTEGGVYVCMRVHACMLMEIPIKQICYIYLH